MPSYSLEIAHAPGMGHDRAAIVAVEGGAVLVVADGAGGMAGAADAAEYVVAGVTRRLARGGLSDADEVAELLQGLDQQLMTERQTGETTAVVAVLRDGLAWGASVGDSEAHVFGAGGSHQDLTLAQRRKPLLGSGSATPVPFGPIAFDGVLVLATDGVWKYASYQAVRALALRQPAPTAAALLELARLPTGRLSDDAAAIIGTPSR